MMMKMEVMVVILRSGMHLISKVEQLDEEPNCHLEDPYLIRDDGTLEPWPRYTTDTDVLLYSETLATIVEPTNEIKKKYEIVTK
jgi:hypothetical protein